MEKNICKLYCKKCGKITEHIIDPEVKEAGDDKFIFTARCCKCRTKQTWIDVL